MPLAGFIKSRPFTFLNIFRFFPLSVNIFKSFAIKKTVREQDICDKEIKNKKELCYNASDQTNKITGDPSYETYYNRRTETS